MNTHGLQLCFVAALVTGCGAAPESTDPPAAPSAEPTPAASSSPRLLLASIQKSDTQVIRFWEHARGVVQVEESANIDSDLRDPTAARGTLLRTNIDGLSLVDAYKLLAGPAAEAASIRTLAEADGRLGKLTPATAAPERIIDSGLQQQTSSRARPEGIGVQAKTQCQITADGWDWGNDVAWFKNTFCGNDSVACYANANYWWVQSGAWYTWQNSWFHATGFEGSFCNTSVFSYRLEVSFCDTTTLIFPNTYNLSPRHYNKQNWYTSGCTTRADWNAKVSASSTGQDYQLRLGLAVHRK